MKKNLRFVAILLVCVMAISLVACVVPEENPPATTPSTTQGPSSSNAEQTTAPETTVNPHADPNLPSVNFNGETYTFLGRSDYHSFFGASRDMIYLEDVKTNSINEAVRDRNTYVSDTYGITIKGNFVESKDYSLTVTTSDRGNVIAGDLISASTNSFANFIDSGVVKDMNSEMNSTYLDLTQSFWNQGCREGMSLCGKLFFISGDIMTADKEGIWAVTFNRDIITNEGLDNPYQLIDNGTWTYKKMYEMAQTACDYEKHDPSDQFGIRWGLVSGSSNTYFMWQGAGNQMITKDPLTDIPGLSELSETAYNTMTDVAVLQYDKTVTILTSDLKGITDTTFDGTIKIFREGHALFNVGSISIAEWLREHDTDFGLCPFPKYSEEQSGYHTGLSNSWSYVVGFQSALGKDNVGNIDPAVIDRVSIITQALACESTATVLEGYYDKTLVYKGLRREDDEKYLKMIFDGRIYDLSLVFDWASGISTEIGNAKKASSVTSLKNKYDKYKNSCDKAINNFLTKQGLI